MKKGRRRTVFFFEKEVRRRGKGVLLSCCVKSGEKGIMEKDEQPWVV
jgi:hypothetical protein